VSDVFTKAKRSAVRARIRSAGNRATELRLAALMRVAHIRRWRRGVRLKFRVGKAGSAAGLEPQSAPRTQRKRKGRKGPDSVRSVSSVVSASAISVPSVVNRSCLRPFAVRPDFVFRTERLAVFVDGCFWHGCPRHVTWPRQNAAFWRRKIEGNRARDRRVDRALRAAGWRVLRIWEHALAEGRAARVVTKIRAAAGQCRETTCRIGFERAWMARPAHRPKTVSIRK
jgi:DNA mismatch endonuclease, patch repair protein